MSFMCNIFIKTFVWFKKPLVHIILSLSIFAILGAAFLHFTWISDVNAANSEALDLARSVATSFQIEQVEKLNAKASDINLSEYNQIKNSLQDLVKVNNSIRFAYFYTLKDDKVYFMVDSEPSDSEDYSPPGQEYTEATAIDKKPFINGESVITSPLTDRWGTWVSILVPVKNPTSGRVIAVFGIDYPANTWHSAAISNIVQAGIIVIISLLLLISFYWVLNKNRSLKKEKANLLLANENIINAQAIYKDMFEKSHAPMLLIKADTGVVFDANSAACSFYGYTKAQLKSIEITNINMQSIEEIRKKFSLINHNQMHFLSKHQLSSGEIRDVDVYASPLTIDGERFIYTIVFDITEKNKLYEALKESERSKDYLLSNLPGIAYRCKFDHDWTMEYVSGGCLALSGYRPEDLVDNKSISYNEIITTEFRDSVRNKWTEALSIKTHCQLEYAIKTIDGKLKWVWEQGQGIYDTVGNVVAIEGLIIDITERKKREEEIIYLNNHDILTGLYNRNFFEQEKKRLDTNRQLPISIIVGDINGLKLINDAIGHNEGDKLLIKIANILKSCCREEDILARIGGDEFSILLPKTCGKDAYAITSRILKACENFREKSDHGSFTSISLGSSTKSTANESLETVIKEAEQYMYKYKLLEHKSIHSNIISSMKATLFEKSHETEKHAERLASLSKAVGKALNLNDDQINELELLSTLHDIGKISVDDHILEKPGKLTDNEWIEMKKHPEAGYRIAKASPDLQSIAELILYHHERWDGKGYPQGLAGESIPLLSRILSVADAYDAMTQDRVYRKAMSKEDAISEIKVNSGTQFDPQIVQAFIKILKTNNE